MIHEAIQALKEGKFILLYDFDDRERETDLTIAASAVTYQDICTMRNDGGGLLCTAVHPLAAERIGLPYATEILSACNAVEKSGDIKYDRKNHSAFSLWVNHRDTFTGITDRDRSKTIQEIANVVKRSLNGGDVEFQNEFRTPGHVPILRAAQNLLDDRRGQTELSIALALMAEIVPAVAVCEMLDNFNGYALSKEEALLYAEKHGLVFIEGEEFVKYFNKWKHDGKL